MLAGAALRGHLPADDGTAAAWRQSRGADVHCRIAATLALIALAITRLRPSAPGRRRSAEPRQRLAAAGVRLA